MTARVGALAKSAGQPYAGNPHVRLEEGAPVGTPCEDIQALPTERGSSSYGLATARPDRALLYTRGLNGMDDRDLHPRAKPRGKAPATARALPLSVKSTLYRCDLLSGRGLSMIVPHLPICSRRSCAAKRHAHVRRRTARIYKTNVS
jgi:hypothetical protein